MRETQTPRRDLRVGRALRSREALGLRRTARKRDRESHAAARQAIRLLLLCRAASRETEQDHERESQSARHPGASG